MRPGGGGAKRRPLYGECTSKASASSVCGLKLLVYEAFAKRRPLYGEYTSTASASSVCGLTLLVYAALSYWCMRP